MKLYFLVLSLALVQLAVSQNNQNTDDGVWNDLASGELDGSTTIQNALTFGVGRVVANAVQAGNIPDTSYDVSGIYYAQQQQQVPQTNYRFEVQVLGADGTIWRIKCDVNVANGQNNLLRSRGGQENDSRWDRTLQFGAFQFRPQDVYVPAQPQTPATPAEPVEPVEPTTPAENTTTPNTTSSLASEVWALVDPQEVDTNEDIQKALVHGVSSVIDLAVQNGSFPDANYDIVGIYSVLKQQQVVQNNYRFEVEVMSDIGQPFRVKYDVNVATDGRMDTYRWRFGGIDAAAWDREMEFGNYDYLPDEVYLADEDYLDAEEDQLAPLDDGLALLL